MPRPRRRFDAVLEEKTGIRLAVDGQNGSPTPKPSGTGSRPIVSFASVPSRGSVKSDAVDGSSVGAAVAASTSFLTPRRSQLLGGDQDDDLVLQPFPSSETSRSATPLRTPVPFSSQDRIPSFASTTTNNDCDATKGSGTSPVGGKTSPVGSSTGGHRIDGAVLDSLQAALDRLVTVSMDHGEAERVVQLLDANRQDAGDRRDGRSNDAMQRSELSEKIVALQSLDPSEVKMCLAGNAESGEIYDDLWSSVKSEAEREAIRLVHVHFPADATPQTFNRCRTSVDGTAPEDDAGDQHATSNSSYVIDDETGTLLQLWEHRAAGRYYMSMLKGLAVARAALLLPSFVAVPFAVSVASAGRFVSVTWLPPLRGRVPKHLCAPCCPPSHAAAHSASFGDAISEMFATYMQWRPHPHHDGPSEEASVTGGASVREAPPPWSLYPGHDDRLYVVPSRTMLCHQTSTVAHLAGSNVYERFEYMPLDSFAPPSASEASSSPTSTVQRPLSRVSVAIKERLLPLIVRNVVGLCRLSQTSDTQWLSRYFHACGVGIKCTLVVHRALGQSSTTAVVDARHRPFLEQLRGLMVSEVLARALKTLILRHVNQCRGGPSSQSTSFLGASGVLGSSSRNSASVGAGSVVQPHPDVVGEAQEDDNLSTSPTSPVVVSGAAENTVRWKTLATAVTTVTRLDTDNVRPSLAGDAEGGNALVAAVATTFLKKTLHNRRFLSKTVLSHIFRKYDDAHDLVLDLEAISTPLIVRHLEARLGLRYDAASRAFVPDPAPVVLQSAGRDGMDVASITNDAALLADRVVSMGTTSNARCTAAATVSRLSLYYALVATQNAVPGAENVFAGAVGRAAVQVKMLARHPTRRHEHLLLMLCLGRLGLNTSLMYRALGAVASLPAPALHINHAPQDAAPPHVGGSDLAGVAEVPSLSTVVPQSNDALAALDGFVVHTIIDQSMGVVERASDKGQPCTKGDLLSALIRQWATIVCSSLERGGGNEGVRSAAEGAGTHAARPPDVLDGFSLGALRNLMHHLLATAAGSRVRKDTACSALIERLLAATAWCSVPLQHAATVLHNVTATRLLEPSTFPQPRHTLGSLERLVLRVGLHAAFDVSWAVAAIALLPTYVGGSALAVDDALTQGLLLLLDGIDDDDGMALRNVAGIDGVLQQAERFLQSKDCAQCFLEDAERLGKQPAWNHCRTAWQCRWVEQQVVALLPTAANSPTYIVWLLARRIRVDIEKGLLLEDATHGQQLLMVEEDEFRSNLAVQSASSILAARAAAQQRSQDQGVAIIQKVHHEAIHKKALVLVDDVAKASLTGARTKIAVRSAQQRKEEHLRQMAEQRSLVEDEGNGRQGVLREEAACHRTLTTLIHQRNEELGIAMVQKVHREAIHTQALQRIADVVPAHASAARAAVEDRNAQAARAGVLASIAQRIADRRKEAGARMAAELAHAKAAVVYQLRQEKEQASALSEEKRLAEAATAEQRTAAVEALQRKRADRIKMGGAAVASRAAAEMAERARQQTYARAFPNIKMRASGPVGERDDVGDDATASPPSCALTTNTTQLEAARYDVDAAQPNYHLVQVPQPTPATTDGGQGDGTATSAGGGNVLRVRAFSESTTAADAQPCARPPTTDSLLASAARETYAACHSMLPNTMAAYDAPLPLAVSAGHNALAFDVAADRLPTVGQSVEKFLLAFASTGDAGSSTAPPADPNHMTASKRDQSDNVEVYAVERAKQHAMQSIRQQQGASKTGGPAPDTALVAQLVRGVWTSTPSIDPSWGVEGSTPSPRGVGGRLPLPPAPADFSLRSPLLRPPLLKGDKSNDLPPSTNKKAAATSRPSNSPSSPTMPTSSPHRKPLRLIPLPPTDVGTGGDRSSEPGTPLTDTSRNDTSVPSRSDLDQMHTLHAAVVEIATAHRQEPSAGAVTAATHELAPLLAALAPWYAAPPTAASNAQTERRQALFLRDVVCYEAKREQILLLLVSQPPPAMAPPGKGGAASPASPVRTRNTMHQVVAECCASCVRAHQLHRMAYVLHLRAVVAMASTTTSNTPDNRALHQGQGIVSSLRALQWALLMCQSVVLWSRNTTAAARSSSTDGTKAAGSEEVPLLLGLQDASVRSINLGNSSLPDAQRILQSPSYAPLAALAKSSVRTTSDGMALIATPAEALVVAAACGTVPLEAWLEANNALPILDAFTVVLQCPGGGVGSSTAGWLSALLNDVLAGLATAFELRESYQEAVFTYRLRAEFTTTAFGDRHPVALAAQDAANDKVRRELAFVQEVSKKRLDGCKPIL